MSHHRQTIGARGGAWRQAIDAAPATRPDDVHLARWEDYPDPSVRDIVDLCTATGLPYLLVRTDDRRAAGGAGGELEALGQLEREPDVALVLVGDVDILVRRSFLLGLVEQADILDARDVVPELTDVANARGMRVTFAPG